MYYDYEAVVFDNTGIIQDAVMAVLVYEKALRLNIGIPLSLN